VPRRKRSRLVLGLVGQDLLGLFPGGQARLDVVLLLAGVVQPQDGACITQVLVSGMLLLDQPPQDRQVVPDLLGLPCRDQVDDVRRPLLAVAVDASVSLLV
jgi:hypothetical protein